MRFLRQLPTNRLRGITVVLFASLLSVLAQNASLPGTKRLTGDADLSLQMVSGIDKFFASETERSTAQRSSFWNRDFTSAEAYERSISLNRNHLRKIIGAVDERLPVKCLEFVTDTENPAQIAQGATFSVFAVRWPVFEGVFAEGLWLRPKSPPLARIVAVPDADQTPEMIAGLVPGLNPERQFARRLAEQGCEVLVPVLINRDDTCSGNTQLKRFTNQPHREWIYRQAFQMGRHIIGYEVQKVLAAVDWFELSNSQIDRRPQASGIMSSNIGVVGYGEGGLIAFYSAALDSRIRATLVSGYFNSRNHLHEEPVYRNVFGLLREFGDAEIASLIAPRALIIEHSNVPKVNGPPKPREDRTGAAPGKLTTPDYQTVEAEFERARVLVKAAEQKAFDNLILISGTEGNPTGPLSDRASEAFLKALGSSVEPLKMPEKSPEKSQKNLAPAERQARQVTQLVEHTQKLYRDSERVRKDFFWQNLKTDSADAFASSTRSLRDYFGKEIIGVLTNAPASANPRSRKLMETTTWTGYEIAMDVFPEVLAWGYLLLPENLKPGERRPVVVCQHGLEGRPMDVVLQSSRSESWHIYKGFAVQLVERGFVVFAPHNPYRGEDRFRQLQRKANPLGTSLFAIITAQHSQILDWLAEQPFVDVDRIGFYGLSYGGNTAMHVPPLLDRYALSICSASFNEWTRKVACVDYSGSFMYVPEYEMFEFNLGNTFGHAEMAALIAPRPFMVERGHSDPVGTDEWISYEFAKVQRLYNQLNLGSNANIEFFNGGHTINGVGTFEFLHKHLNWPKPNK